MGRGGSSRGKASVRSASSPLPQCRNRAPKVRRLQNPITQQVPVVAEAAKPHPEEGFSDQTPRYGPWTVWMPQGLCQVRGHPRPGERGSQMSPKRQGTWANYWALTPKGPEGRPEQRAGEEPCSSMPPRSLTPFGDSSYPPLKSERTSGPAPPFPASSSESLSPQPVLSHPPSSQTSQALSHNLPAFHSVAVFCTQHTPHQCPPRPCN